MVEQQLPKITSSLTSKQKDYIRKLGSTKGREIIPVDMHIYRDLMKLDIIVDKGRRLALTKFGKEVCRHL